MSFDPIDKILDGMLRLDVVKVELVGGSNTIGIQTTDSNGQIVQYVLSTILVEEGKAQQTTEQSVEKKEETTNVKN